jgi:hypothetical protein
MSRRPPSDEEPVEDPPVAVTGVIIDGTTVTFEDSITDTTTTAALTVTTEDGDFTASVDLEVWDNALDRDLIGSWSSDGGTTVWTFNADKTYTKATPATLTGTYFVTKSTGTTWLTSNPDNSFLTSEYWHGSDGNGTYFEAANGFGGTTKYYKQ